MSLKPIEFRFACPFCPVVLATPGEIEVCAGEGPDGAYLTHTMPTCSAFDAIDMDRPGWAAAFVAACRHKLAGRS